MRDAFADELLRLADTDERVVLLMGDIGNRMFDRFKARHPSRFHNCGVAEQNMMGVAAGLAMGGLRPVVYTIVPFVTTRCLEQIRVDVCYHNQPVTIVGVGGGLSYASLGATHHSCEDIAFLRALPGMRVVCPGDAFEVRGALRAALGGDVPAYIRLGKKGEPAVHTATPDLVIGKSITLRPGRDVALLSTGNLLPAAVAAGDMLRAQGIDARVESFHTVKPLDEACLREVFAQCPLVATVEEHSVLGGLGGAVAEWLARQDRAAFPATLLSVGTPDEFPHRAGEQEHLRTMWGLTAEGIARHVAERMATSEPRP